LSDWDCWFLYFYDQLYSYEQLSSDPNPETLPRFLTWVIAKEVPNFLKERNITPESFESRLRRNLRDRASGELIPGPSLGKTKIPTYKYATDKKERGS
jgi:hypothetical protein